MSEDLRKANADTIALILIEEGGESAESAGYLAVKIASTFDPSPLKCGHPLSLLVRSVESDYQFCELCEAHKERNDAIDMEETLSERVRELSATLRSIARAAQKATRPNAPTDAA